MVAGEGLEGSSSAETSKVSIREAIRSSTRPADEVLISGTPLIEAYGSCSDWRLKTFRAGPFENGGIFDGKTIQYRQDQDNFVCFGQTNLDSLVYETGEIDQEELTRAINSPNAVDRFKQLLEPIRWQKIPQDIDEKSRDLFLSLGARKPVRALFSSLYFLRADGQAGGGGR